MLQVPACERLQHSGLPVLPLQETRQDKSITAVQQAWPLTGPVPQSGKAVLADKAEKLKTRQTSWSGGECIPLAGA